MEFEFHTTVWLPQPRGHVFNFFADAGNLEIITPSWLKFEVLTPLPLQMRPGALIDYRLRIHRLPIRWQTEIVEWEPSSRFVDVQRRGPYKLWHHTHTFAERDGGTLCADHVRYYPRGGRLIDRLFVRRDIERIFKYRQERLLQLFDKSSVPQ